MPGNVRTIFFINILIVFVYAVLFSSLMIFLTKKIGFSAARSESIVGLFLALNFILHLFAGFISDRLLSNRYLLLVSTLIKVLGIYILSLGNSEYVYLGLALVVTGCGINSTCLQCMLSAQFEQEDQRREVAFFWMYSALNIGFFLGFTLSGYFDINNDFTTLYRIGVITSMLAIVSLVFYWSNFKSSQTIFSLKSRKERIKSRILGTLLIIGLIPLLNYSFHYPKNSNYCVVFIGAITLLLIVASIFKCKEKRYKNGIFAFLILAIFSIFYWSLYYVGPLGGLIFLENNIDLSLLGYQVAPQWLMNLNSVFIVFGSPILITIINKLRGRGFNISIPRQFCSALFFIAISYFIFAIGIHFSNDQGKTAIIWVVLHYLFQSMSELFIAPVGYAMIGELIPKRLQSFMMGTWMMLSGIAIEFSNLFSHLMTRSGGYDPLLNNNDYFEMFNILSITTVVLAIIMLFFIPFLERLVNSASDK
tara:strand:- start:1085 stop:2518 length:1434 start_codon:yes stop_codon:yes gene_type:complete